MAYIHFGEEEFSGNTFGCGPDCTCGPCRSGHHTLSEFYFRDEDREPTLFKATNLGRVAGLGSTGRTTMPPPRKATISERRGWKSSKPLISQKDFRYIEQMLIEPSWFQRYFIHLHGANPTMLFSNSVTVLQKNSFESKYKKIHRKPPAPNVRGTVDKRSGRAYLRAFNVKLQVDLESALYEAVHFFSCPLQGPHTPFRALYGHVITEGFTQYITEEILKKQELEIVKPSAYPNERVVAAKLIEAVGLQNLADDYFHCRGTVRNRLHRMGVLREFDRLRKEAEKQRSVAAKKGEEPPSAIYEKLLRFLERIKSSAVR